MNRKLLSALCVAAMTVGGAAQAQDSGMTFFLATNPGKGADLGGLMGADARCQALAKEANAGAEDVAGVSQHHGRGRTGGGECARPDRQGAVAQREGRGGGEGRRRAARESEHQLRDRAHGERRAGE